MAKGARVHVPELMLWGEDVALSRHVAQPGIEYCDDGGLLFFPGATHWVRQDDPDYLWRFSSSTRICSGVNPRADNRTRVW